MDRLGGDRLALAPASMPLRQPGNVGGMIEAAARIGGIRLGADTATADIGVKRLRLGAETRQCLVGGEPGHGGLALINYVKIDVN